MLRTQIAYTRNTYISNSNLIVSSFSKSEAFLIFKLEEIALCIKSLVIKVFRKTQKLKQPGIIRKGKAICVNEALWRTNSTCEETVRLLHIGCWLYMDNVFRIDLLN